LQVFERIIAAKDFAWFILHCILRLFYSGTAWKFWNLLSALYRINCKQFLPKCRTIVVWIKIYTKKQTKICKKFLSYTSKWHH